MFQFPKFRNLFKSLGQDIGSKEEGGLHVEKQPIWLVQEVPTKIESQKLSTLNLLGIVKG